MPPYNGASPTPAAAGCESYSVDHAERQIDPLAKTTPQAGRFASYARRVVNADIDLHTIDELTGGRLGRFDVRCMYCGPERQTLANQRRRVMRIWRIDPGFASFHCARCGESGYARDGSGRQIDRAVFERARVEAQERERETTAERLAKAHWLWSQSKPIIGTIAEQYLRDARGYRTGPLPATLRFLPARGAHGPAMLAGFGIPTELEPGRLTISRDAVRGVHITRLAPDGSGKAGTDADKIFVGRSTGWPIVLAPANDLLAIGVTEGIEDALSIHMATGLGAWAAGCTSRLPAISGAVPYYVSSVTIYAHDDEDGKRDAYRLAAALFRRRIEVRLEGIAP